MRKIIFLALNLALFAQFAAIHDVKAQVSLSDVTRACRTQSQQPVSPKARQIVSVVTEEWRRFGSNPRYPSEVKYRIAEDAWTELLNPVDDKLENVFTWARVHLYWQATGNSGTLVFPYDLAKTPDGHFRRDGDNLIVRRTVNLNQALAGLEKLSADAGDSALRPEIRKAFRIAATRASLIEQPWSAVFISTMMKVAELPEGQFRSSGSHSGYMQEALAASLGERPNYRYIACPPDPDIRVRSGDLICNARGTTKPGFNTLWIGTSGFVSHCDVVAAVTTDGANFRVEAIGGNVQDNVTRTVYSGAGAPSLAAITPSRNWLAVLLLR